MALLFPALRTQLSEHSVENTVHFVSKVFGEHILGSIEEESGVVESRNE